MLKLLFIRHGESIGNQEQRMAGRHDDGLTATGRQQCRQLGTWLHQHHWQPSHIYTSPQRRAVESVAELIPAWGWQLSGEQILHASSTWQLDVSEPSGNITATNEALPKFAMAAALQEFDAGILTGLTWAEARAQYPTLCEALETSPDWVAIPQAETPLAGRDRASRLIEEIVTHHRNRDALWIISHHWIMEHLIAGLMGCDRTWQIKISNTALFEFWVDQSRWFAAGINRGISDLWQIKRFGDRPHWQ